MAMTRRAFLHAVIVSTLAAPLVTRRQKRDDFDREIVEMLRVYRPHPKQREFFESRAPRVVYGGYRGGFATRYEPGKWYKGY